MNNEFQIKNRVVAWFHKYAIALFIILHLILESTLRELTNDTSLYGNAQVISEDWYFILTPLCFVFMGLQMYGHRLIPIAAISCIGFIFASLGIVYDELYGDPFTIEANDIISYSIGLFFLLAGFIYHKVNKLQIGSYLSYVNLSMVVMLTVAIPYLKMDFDFPAKHLIIAGILFLFSLYTLLVTMIFRKDKTAIVSCIFVALLSNNFLDEIMGIATETNYARKIVAGVVIVSGLIYYYNRDKDWVKRFLVISG